MSKKAKYFSYSEVVKNPELKFTNNKNDGVIYINTDLVKETLKFFITIIKNLNSK